MIAIVISKYGLVGVKFPNIIKVTSTLKLKKNKQPPYSRKSQTLVSGVGRRKKTGYHTRHVKKMPA